MPAASRLRLSRRMFLVSTAATASIAAGWGAWPAGRTADAGPGTATDPRREAGDDPLPLPALQAIIDALDRYPLVALGDKHQLQEEHDLLQALLHHPALPGKITDIVVEFGNALYQDVVDRFVAGEPVADADLRKVWRYTVGGLGGVWDPPVYEQVFRTVRAVNWLLPAEKRLRVLLGDPPVDFGAIRSVEDLGAYVAANPIVLERDAHYAGVVEREVLEKGRRALLIAGNRHLKRGLAAEGGRSPNAGSLIAQQHPGALFVVDVLLVPPGGMETRAARLVASWTRPALALLAGTWLGAQDNRSDPVLDDAAARYEAQADAVLYLGAADQLTASRAEPAIYLAGDYHDEMQRIADLVAMAGLGSNNSPEDALRVAQLGPGYFEG